MSLRTTVSIDDFASKELNKFQSQIILDQDGKKISKSHSILLLIAGYKNPEFNESEFLKSLEDGE